jgi:segregation and condensation protein B
MFSNPTSPEKMKELEAAIEGLLFVAGDEGLDTKQIAEVLECDKETVSRLLTGMKRKFDEEGRGVQIVELAGTWQLTTRPEHAVFFQRLAYSPARGTLSQAALETLAIIAYRQPVTRVDIEEIRGVKSDRAIHTLVAKGLIKPVGRADVIGRPILYGTTDEFLDYFGLKSLDELPDAKQFEHAENLEQETHLLYEKLKEKQLTIDELEEME